jgi:hypothetical protein
MRRRAARRRPPVTTSSSDRIHRRREGSTVGLPLLLAVHHQDVGFGSHQRQARAAPPATTTHAAAATWDPGGPMIAADTCPLMPNRLLRRLIVNLVPPLMDGAGTPAARGRRRRHPRRPHSPPRDHSACVIGSPCLGGCTHCDPVAVWARPVVAAAGLHAAGSLLPPLGSGRRGWPLVHSSLQSPPPPLAARAGRCGGAPGRRLLGLIIAIVPPPRLSRLHVHSHGLRCGR